MKEFALKNRWPWVKVRRVEYLIKNHYIMTASRYRVQSIPTLIFFRNGQEVDRMVGALPKGDIERWLRDRL